MYHFVMGLLIIGAVIEFIQRKTPQKLYILLIVVLAFMLCFRYGQGTDYFGYYLNYSLLPDVTDFFAYSLKSIHGDIGWKFICAVFKRLGLSYQWYVGIWSAVEMLLLINFIQKFCPMKIVALLMAYHTVYLTYMFSAQRQGLVLCVFMSVLLDFLMKEKWREYFLGVCACALIHSAALVLLILPLAFKIRWMGLSNQFIIICVCLIAGLMIYFLGLDDVVINAMPYVRFQGSGSVSLFGIVERFATYAAIMYATSIYFKYNKGKSATLLLRFVEIYSLGLMVYGLTFWAPGLASRIMIFFKATEIAIVSVVLTDRGKTREILFAYCAALSMIMYLKNIDSYISQGLYFDEISIWNYPYVSIFESEDILNYRDIFYSTEYFD